ncbi:hypothetical protein DEU56DRAFT_157841 [Suillus clintonianus]|uniref:uncharacterized protein n=1 Tax=Suillus clintonianus TaxID=1904413 RepID=UPI001B85EADD|nr:uncharacterized protein DEU56DRAFT_157841 [Suillus clintonianus]KAG2117706.1 hypothetical protein DEU56DRAFT_157841 [Suillus clintonianus]
MALPTQFAESLWVRTSFSAAGHTLLVYDYLLTFKYEVFYIWNAPWTVVKVLFLLNRYGNLIGQTAIRLEEAGLLAQNSQEFCQRFAFFTTCFMYLSTESIHIVVLVRAWAIWGTRKRVTMILIWSYMLYVVVLLAVSANVVSSSRSPYLYLDVIHVCVVTVPKFVVWVSYVGSFILDVILFVLTMRSLWKYSREFQHLYPSNLLHVLFRDAAIFFIASMFSNALIVASWTAFREDPKYFLGKGFATPLLSVAGQRLVLNLRGLKTRTYTTRDISREVDRQLQAFAEAESPDGDDIEEVERVRE